jgi:hypothetical protein
MEIGLGLFDPLGLHFVQQLDFVAPYMINTMDDYRLAPGTYDMHEWQITINPDGMRNTPDSGQGCRVVFYGDSVTFGWGVQDQETFANQLAQDWPNVEIINTGVTGYNSHQVYNAVETVPADVGVYLIINNDAEESLQLGGHTPKDTHQEYMGFGMVHGNIPATRIYFFYVLRSLILRTIAIPSAPRMDMARYADDLAAIDQQDVLLFAFDTELGRWTSDHYPVNILERYTTTVSMADAHPDAAGHKVIADQMRAPITDAILARC